MLPITLGIESSCDETGIALYQMGRGLLAHALHTQVAMHNEYGGVVPELASRDHVRRIIPLLRQVMHEANVSLDQIDAIAYTQWPGLGGALLVGASVANALAYALGIPVIGIHHLEGHLLSPLLSDIAPEFPFVALLVSGGHTQLMRVDGVGQYTLLGETLDDAAGEAFDKSAKLLGLGYPGGPIISQYAAEYLHVNNGVAPKTDIVLPRPMLNAPTLNFSFSGLKTALLYQLKKDKNWQTRIPQYCYEYQQAILDVLIGKTIKAAKKYNVKTIMLAGGVAANKQLRQQMEIKVLQKLPELAFNFPAMAYTTDNAAMIAAAGYFKYLKKDFTPWDSFTVNPNESLN